MEIPDLGSIESTGQLQLTQSSTEEVESSSSNGQLQLSDLTARYPDQTTPNLQQLLTAKREYAELGSPAVEPMLRKRNCLFRHQLLFRRHLTHSDVCLVIDDTGTGKTCTITELVQYYRENKDHIRYAYILVSGPTQKLEFKRQLACICTVGVYETESIKKTISTQGQQMAVSLEIKKWYKIRTYASMASEIAEYPISVEGNISIIKEYSGCIFFIDEVQNIKIDPFAAEDGGTSRRGNRGPRVKAGTTLIQLQQSTKKKKLEREQVYTQIWRLFHLVQRSKLIIASATPMINSVGELASHLNLILPLNQQLEDKLSNTLFSTIGLETPEVNKIDFAKVNLEDIKPFLQGRISYVRATEVGAIPLYMGSRLQHTYQLPVEVFEPNIMMERPGVKTIERPSQLVLDALELSGKQAEVYASLGTVGEDPGYGESGGSDSLYNSYRSVASFVFPDGSYGEGSSMEVRRKKKMSKAVRKGVITSEQLLEYSQAPTEESMAVTGFSKYVDVEVVEDGITFYKANEELRRIIGSHQLRDYSVKTYAQVMRAVSGNRTLSGSNFNASESGKRYVYCRTVTGGGAIVKGLCYEAWGFQRFARITSVFENTQGRTRPFCPPERSGGQEEEARYGRRLIAGFDKRPRYAILSRSTTKTDAQVNAILELFNSPENIDGEYLQVLLVSPIGQYGINLTNTKHVEIDGPEWTPSSLYQARNRAFRATSHVDLVERAIRDIEEGRAARDAVPIQVRVRLYATVLKQGDSYVDTIDVMMYKAAEYKDFFIRRTMRMLKQLSFGCQLHRDRNIRDPSYDGTADCDYDACNYPCSDQSPSKLDSTTYDVYYYDEIVSSVSKLLIRYFRHNMSAKIEDLQQAFPGVKHRKYFIFALEQIISTKFQMRDRFGFPCYLRQDRDTYYITRSFPHLGVDNEVGSRYYSRVLVGLNATTLRELTNALTLPRVNQYVQFLLNQGVDQITEIMTDPESRLIIQAEVALLEESLVRYVNTGTTSPATSLILNMYHGNLVTLREPRTVLRELEAAYSRNTSIRIDASSLEIPRVFDPNIRYSEDTVFIHTLMATEERGTSFSEFIKYLNLQGELRIFRRSDGKWRNLTETEKKIYHNVVHRYLNGVMAFFHHQNSIDGIHGIIISDRFLIRDMKGQEPSTSEKRAALTGMECQSQGIGTVVGTMWRLGIPRLKGSQMWDVSIQTESITEEDMDEYLERRGIEDREGWSKDRKIYYYTHINANNTNYILKDRMCLSILLWLASFGRPKIFYVKGDPMVAVRRILRSEGQSIAKLFQKYQNLNANK